MGWRLVADGGSQQVELSGPRASHWLGVMERLDQRRIAAWQRLNPNALRRVYAPGSAPLTEERELMLRYAESGVVRIEGLDTPIESLDVRSDTGNEVVLAVRARLDPYVVVAEDGSFEDPGERASGRRIVLSPAGGGEWLIERSDRSMLPEPDNG